MNSVLAEGRRLYECSHNYGHAKAWLAWIINNGPALLTLAEATMAKERVERALSDYQRRQRAQDAVDAAMVPFTEGARHNMYIPAFTARFVGFCGCDGDLLMNRRVENKGEGLTQELWHVECNRCSTSTVEFRTEVEARRIAVVAFGLGNRMDSTASETREPV